MKTFNSLFIFDVITLMPKMISALTDYGVTGRAFKDKNLNIRLELEHTEAIKRAVESGLGIGCISRLALKDAFRRGSLVPLDVPSIKLNRFFYFLWPKKKYQTSGMKQFLALCKKMTKGLERSDQVNLPLIP